MAGGRGPSRTPDLFPSLTQLSFLQPAGKPEIALATRQPCPYNQPHEPVSAVGLSDFAWNLIGGWLPSLTFALGGVHTSTHRNAMNHEKTQAAHQQPTSAAIAPLVRIDVCGVENIVTILSRRDSAMQDSYTFAGLSQKVTVSLLPGTRVSIDMTGADNRVLVSKELTVVASENTGAGNQWDYLSDQ